MEKERSLIVIGLTILMLSVSSCDTVPKESVELSNTVGRDLEEVHRAHRALAELHFVAIEREVNQFINTTYRPVFIRQFAEEFKLNDQIKLILAEDPDKLLPVLTRFVEIAVVRIEAKRAELLDPIAAQKQSVISEIDKAHRQIQAAQAVVTGHLASVRKVREVQNEVLAKVGLGDLSGKIAGTTADISNRVAAFVEQGQRVEAGVDSASQKINQLNAQIEKLRTALKQETDS